MKLRLYPDEALTTKCDQVTDFNDELHKTLEEMRLMMDRFDGLGLAANQVGILKRFFIMRDKHGLVYEFINPVIKDSDDLANMEEGCLSAPGIADIVTTRAKYVVVEAQDRKGETFKVLAEEIEAVCVQHELDHLDGIFYFDRMQRTTRRRKQKEWEKIREKITKGKYLH